MMGHRHVFLVSLALLLVATTHAACITQAAITQQGTDGVVVVGSMSMVGSRPPSCKGKCGWLCVGRRSCEAVLVPIEPPEEQHNKQSRRHGSGGGGDGSRASAAQRRRPSWYDDGGHSNYKSVAWRCQCVGAS